MAVLVDPAYPDSEAMVRDLAAAARAMGLQIQVFNGPLHSRIVPLSLAMNRRE